MQYIQRADDIKDKNDVAGHILSQAQQVLGGAEAFVQNRRPMT